LGWWNSSNKNIVNSQATVSTDTAQKNADNQTAKNEELTTLAKVQKVELDEAYATITQLKASTLAIEAKANEELHKTKEEQENQLHEALSTIESLRKDLGIARQKLLQTIDEREAMQVDLEKLRTTQSEVTVELASQKPAVKPWYRLW
jgi:hypothetical protein